MLRLENEVHLILFYSMQSKGIPFVGHANVYRGSLVFFARSTFVSWDAIDISITSRLIVGNLLYHRRKLAAATARISNFQFTQLVSHNIPSPLAHIETQVSAD